MNIVRSADTGRLSRVQLAALAIAVTLFVQVLVAVAATGTAEAVDPPQNGRIAFTGRSSGPAGADIWTMAPDGSDPKNLTDSADRLEFDPAWSPDGTRIAFGFEPAGGGTSGLGVMDADGAGFLQLSSGRGEANPAWSPDSQWIVFEGTGGALFRVRADGVGGVAQLTFGATATPDWSPDGLRIAVSHDVGPTQVIQSLDVFGGDAIELSPGITDAQHPKYSPDGKRIVFEGFQGSTTDLIVMDADGANRSTMKARGEAPEWSPDGTLVLYASTSSGEPYTFPSAGGGSTILPAWELPVGLDSADGYDWQPIVPDAKVGVDTTGLVDPDQGLWYLYDRATVATTIFYFGNPGDFPIVGDWDCDGIDTPGMYRQSDGYVYLRNSNDQGPGEIKFFFGNPGDIPIAGDFNGDGCATVSIYRPSNQTFYIINELGENDGGLGEAEFSYVFGNPGDKPFVGDFDGDGIETAGLHRESTGLVYFRNSHTQGNADNEFIFGNPDDRLIAGDWNGDLNDSPALYRPSNTTLYFRFTNSQGNADLSFVPTPHGAGWLPVSGTFN